MAERSTGALISLIAGYITLFLTFLLLFIGGRVFNSLLGQLVKEVVFNIYFIILGIHLLCGIMMLIGSHLIKNYDHIFLGSSITLLAGLIGLFTAAGLIIGPLLAIIGAILGFKEEFQNN